jgi:hypothetical protein
VKRARKRVNRSRYMETVRLTADSEEEVVS